ncbi:hypothetical protein TraAM80_09006 [Trypanosoma rangeli]|uniref:Uncharacterized protein n=1 Tax=Trypanosoma rangeli TaxID=5698 RepID=A0A3R7KNC5_TRYRA|nr:uncharacterized protein TraAM80_09006 [Trypanosoma rangeli]RNE98038.1 hypothetical protein TraAM80_09006 [Trypanosoma rangeli]|eukprot:RNE98038.1 hypothetical protein TraAM80_09006 [Trypanosoma rangeli]
MRREDLLQALLVRFVNPQREEQDWLLLAALFYSLTRLLLPAKRMEQLYYKYLQIHGSCAAMKSACKAYETQLEERLRQCVAGGGIPAATMVTGARCMSISSPQTSRGTGILTPATPTGVSAPASGAGGADGGECGSLANLFAPLPCGGGGGVNDGGFAGGEALQQLTPERRQRWRRLRHESISPDVLIALVQQFALVEGAAVFLAPVHPSTIMEFNGARSGPYGTVIMHPLSLMCIKRRVLASRRDYELRQPEKRDAGTDASLDGGNLRTRKRGRVAAAAANEKNETARRKTPADIGDDDTGAIRTLQDLEQAVWHIAANCVVFNAPESYYPFTARTFAVACTKIIEEYCMQRVRDT